MYPKYELSLSFDLKTDRGELYRQDKTKEK